MAHTVLLTKELRCVLCCTAWTLLVSLVGTLPASWGSDAVATLTVIDLSDNQLSGPLPGTWSQLASLQRVNLSSNDLAGQLPDGWATMSNLTTL
jgi:hypothetical protein